MILASVIGAALLGLFLWDLCRWHYVGLIVLVNGAMVHTKSDKAAMLPVTFRTVEEAIVYIKKRGFVKENSLRPFHMNAVFIAELSFCKRERSFHLEKTFQVSKDNDEQYDTKMQMVVDA